MTKTRKTTEEERLEIVEYCVAHDNNYGEAALKYRVSYQQVYQWARKYRQMGRAGLQDRRGKRIGSMPSRTPEEALRDRVAELEHQNRMLRIERDVRRIVKLSATPLRNRPHMVFCSQGTSWGAGSTHGTSVGCNPLAYP